MKAGTPPLRADLVLVGGGHAHVQVLKSFAMQGLPGVRLTLITDRVMAPYSGMLPGCIAGDYSAADMHIDLYRLASLAGARLILAEAEGFDRQSQAVRIKGRPPIRYDVLSLNVGIVPDMVSIAGADAHAVPVKPIAGFLERLTRTEESASAEERPPKIAVLGGGAAGIELAIALQDRAMTHGQPAPEITLIAGSGVAAGLNAGVRKRVLQEMMRRGIPVLDGDPAVAVEEGRITLRSGLTVQADRVFVSTSARLPDWLAKSPFPKAANGGLAIRSTLQVEGEDNVFAAGDCATLVERPRPRAGVYAVRQGPVLADNLRRVLQGQPLRRYKAQKNSLAILRTGPQQAIAGRGRYLAMSGRWVSRLKDRIDRTFMERFRVEPLSQEEDDGLVCAGCAAKVGPDALRDALSRLPEPVAGPSLIGLREADDAAVVRLGESDVVLTVDQISSCVSDPWLFGRITAAHALNDLYAMGATPQHALALATVPEAAPVLMSDDLYQMLAGARAILDSAGASLVGGHSSSGEPLALGFCLTGLLPAAPWRKRGGGKGDALIVTKPLGTGLMLAAGMRFATDGPQMEPVLSSMQQSNAEAARVLRDHGVRAVTDISGFGLLGHLTEMLGEDQSAHINRERIPLFEGVLDLARGGYSSTALSRNRRLMRHVRHGDALPSHWVAILCDPQTSGGLLASVPSRETAHVLKALHGAGYADARCIGHLDEGPFGVSVL